MPQAGPTAAEIAEAIRQAQSITIKRWGWELLKALLLGGVGTGIGISLAKGEIKEQAKKTPKSLLLSTALGAGLGGLGGVLYNELISSDVDEEEKSKRTRQALLAGMLTGAGLGAMMQYLP